MKLHLLVFLLSWMTVIGGLPTQPTPPQDGRKVAKDRSWPSRIGAAAPWLAVSLAGFGVAGYAAVELKRYHTPYQRSPNDDYIRPEDIRRELEDDGNDYWDWTDRCIADGVSIVDVAMLLDPARLYLVEAGS